MRSGSRFHFVSLLAILSVVVIPHFLFAQFQGVLTIHNDNSRTGQNLNETILTTSSVASTSRFGKLASFPVNGQIYAQPLYVPAGVAGLTRNMLYIATEQDLVYGFDADHVANGPVWTANLVPSGRTWKSCVVENCTVCPDVGITGTPVIDINTGTLYVLARTVNPNVQPPVSFQTIHAIDIVTGAVKMKSAIPGGPNFDPKAEGQRVGLLLTNGTLYMGWWSETSSGHGVLKGFDATTLKEVAEFATAPTGLGGIWMSGMGLASDANGFIYLEVADGQYDGISNWGDTILKLDCSTPACTVVDNFTPHNQQKLLDDDIDVGASGLVILPKQCATGCQHPNMLVGQGKDGNVYMIDRDNFGGYNPNQDLNVQTVKGSVHNGFWASPAYWTDSAGTEHVYVGPTNSVAKMYNLNRMTGKLTFSSQSPSSYGFPGPTVSASANGATNGIVWAVERRDMGSESCSPTNAGVLHAYDATDLATELFNSSTCATRDVLAPATKFAVPTVAGGKVFVGASSEVDVYGMYDVPQTCH